MTRWVYRRPHYPVRRRQVPYLTRGHGLLIGLQRRRWWGRRRWQAVRRLAIVGGRGRSPTFVVLRRAVIRRRAGPRFARRFAPATRAASVSAVAILLRARRITTRRPRRVLRPRAPEPAARPVGVGQVFGRIWRHVAQQRAWLRARLRWRPRREPEIPPAVERVVAAPKGRIFSPGMIRGRVYHPGD